MSVVIYTLLATIAVSLCSLVGLVTLSLKDTFLRKTLYLLVGMSAGALMGGAFLHLIAESVEESGPQVASFGVLAGFTLFFIVERMLKWHHCHRNEGDCEVHTFTYMSLLGDSIHNLIDGVIIAAAFVTSVSLGVVTTLAIMAHEIPQEISDFAVLLHGGFTKTKALLANFLTALFAVLGALFGLTISSIQYTFIPYLVPIAAGGFIYIAASDLIPELHREADLKKSLYALIFFLIGIGIMYVLKLFLAV